MGAPLVGSRRHLSGPIRTVPLDRFSTASETDPLMQHRPVAEGLVGRDEVLARVQVVGAFNSLRDFLDQKPEVLSVNEPPCGWLSGGV